MESRIARELQLKPKPLAMMFAEDKPVGSLEYDHDRWLCIISLLDAATAGRTIAIGHEAQVCMMSGQGRCHPQRHTVDLPSYQVPFNYVVLKPLHMVSLEVDQPQVVSMLVDIEQLAMLVQLANHGREGYESVIIPRVSGCQSCYLMPYHESQQEVQRAVVGMTDPFSRRFVNHGKLAFSTPIKMFLEMEEHVEAGVLRQLAPRS